MRKLEGKKVTAIAMVLGVLLIVASMAAMIFNHVSQNKYKEEIPQIVSEIYSLIPEVMDSVPDAPADITMPVMEIGGQDYVGILEVPAYGKVLPVYGEWNKRKVSRFPCRFTGSIYDGSLIIGTSENPGQFDITKVISGGDEVFFVDMTGLRYKYIVTDIFKTKDVSTSNLKAQEADLVIFVKSSYGSEYMIINCEI